MTHYISHEVKQFGAARTPPERGFVVFAHQLGANEVREADIVILASPDGSRVPGRYIGAIDADQVGEDVHELVGLYRIAEGGVPLSSLFDDGVGSPSSKSGRHDWGAMGLPEGLATPVRPLGAGVVARDDAAVALSSSGYRRYLSDRSLSIAPGETVTVKGEKVRLIAVDRRRRLVEIDTNGKPCEIGFELIDELESAT